MKTVIIAENALDPASWETYEVPGDLRDFLMARFGKWPQNARIYHHQVAQSCDVTPSDKITVEKLGKLEGTFYIVVYPSGGVPWWGWVMFPVGLNWYVYNQVTALWKKPKTKETRNESPNNSLGDRRNEARINGRIPDIYGTVRSTPDLIAVPYKIYEGGRQVEYSLMCIGRGSYEYWPSDPSIREDTTDVFGLTDYDVEIWGPNTGPNQRASWLANLTNSMVAYYRMNPDSIPAEYQAEFLSGRPILEPLYVVKQYSGLNGFRLVPYTVVNKPNECLQIVAPNIIRAPEVIEEGTAGSGPWTDNFKEIFVEGGSLSITENFDVFHSPMTFDGTYTIGKVTSNSVELVNPAANNSNWNNVGAAGTKWNQQGWCQLWAVGHKWSDPLIISEAKTTELWVNFVASSGLYSVDENGTQYVVTVDLSIQVDSIDPVTGDPSGSPTFYGARMSGSSTNKRAVNYTTKIKLPAAGKYQVKIKRVTDRFSSPGDTYVDDIQIETIYGAYELDPTQYPNFGDVTIVRTRVENSPDTRAVGERRFNILVQRKVAENPTANPLVLSGSNRVDRILAAVALDTKIGRRTLDELDWTTINTVINEVITYFGSSRCAEFNYTFDDENTSFEEMFTSIAATAFSHAYRGGSDSKLKIKFEKATEDSILLFNHRNKIPGSETRTVTFGNLDDVDGVELEWTDPEDDAKTTYTVPIGGTVTNPKKIETIGIRSKIQAHMHAYRAWNKIKYQVLTVEFEATEEADVLTLWDRILVADNTRPDTMDGEILSVNGLELTLSQDADLS